MTTTSPPPPPPPPPPYNPLQSDYDLLTTPEPETDSSSIETLKPNPTILHLAFNQDHTCFTAATDSSFRVYTCDPLRRCDSDSTGPRGGVGLVQMLFHSNYFAVVGGGPDPFSPPNKVMIWDDRLSRCIGHLGFRSDIRGVRIRRDRIVVVLLNKVAVYNFDNLKPFDEMMTLDNPKGLCEVSTKSGPAVVACPGLHPGQVRVHHYGSKRTKFIMAHCSDLACFTLTQDGRFLATASSKGTLVRVFNTLDGTLLQEVRRGADRAEIYSLAFSSTAQWLAVSSDKGTVHVFSVKIDSGASGNDNSGSTSEDGAKNPSGLFSLPYLKAVLPSYFSSEWSVAKFRLEEGVKHLVAFGHQKHTVVILGMNGSFYRCQFDPVNGGEMTQLEHSNFLQPEGNFKALVGI